MSVPILVNPFANDPSKVIQARVGFLKVAPDDKGEPQILISPDLKKIFRNRNGVVVPLSDKSTPANTIITFDAANQNITSGALVPPENKLTAFNDNSLRTQILSNQGHIISTVGTQYGWFMSLDDLLVVGNGTTWKMSWVMDFATTQISTSFQLPHILTADIVTPGPTAFRAQSIMFMNFQGNGEHLVVRYRDTSDVFQVLLNVPTANSPEGTSVICSIARTGTQFVFVFDEGDATTLGKQTAAINKPLVKAHTVNKFFFGDDTNDDFFGTLNINDITYPNAS